MAVQAVIKRQVAAVTYYCSPDVSIYRDSVDTHTWLLNTNCPSTQTEPIASFQRLSLACALEVWTAMEQCHVSKRVLWGRQCTAMACPCYLLPPRGRILVRCSTKCTRRSGNTWEEWEVRNQIEPAKKKSFSKPERYCMESQCRKKKPRTDFQGPQGHSDETWMCWWTHTGPVSFQFHDAPSSALVFALARIFHCWQVSTASSVECQYDTVPTLMWQQTQQRRTHRLCDAVTCDLLSEPITVW